MEGHQPIETQRKGGQRGRTVTSFRLVRTSTLYGVIAGTFCLRHLLLLQLLPLHILEPGPPAGHDGQQLLGKAVDLERVVRLVLGPGFALDRDGKHHRVSPPRVILLEVSVGVGVGGVRRDFLDRLVRPRFLGPVAK